MLEGEADRYGGVRIQGSQLPHNPKEFEAMLDESLAQWESQGVRGVWIEVPLHLTEFVPLAVRRGFQPHHAESSYIMLTLWLPKHEASTLPPNASHQVGVGAFLVGPQGHVLLVQEKRGPAARPNYWKIPTGAHHRQSAFPSVIVVQ